MRLERLAFDRLPGWSAGEAAAAWPVFIRSARAIVSGAPELRGAVSPGADLVQVCREALERESGAGDADRSAGAAEFFQTRFQPARIRADGFLTGYYEPEVPGSLDPTSGFTAPMRARPGDLVDMRTTTAPGWISRFEGARRTAAGDLEPYPARAEIESGAIDDAARPIVWLRDPVEAFLVQVQGSARVVLPDGSRLRLVYDGRNGRPYTSVGRLLIESGVVPAAEMSLARLKAGLRALGLGPGEPGRAIMQRNESYVFFRLERSPAGDEGPIGGQGLALTARRSLAIDRSLWPYGLPFWTCAQLPALDMARDKGRLWIAQDTGSAIVGPARGDLFAGAGEAAGALAGGIRHDAECFVLLPRVG